MVYRTIGKLLGRVDLLGIIFILKNGRNIEKMLRWVNLLGITFIFKMVEQLGNC